MVNDLEHPNQTDLSTFFLTSLGWLVLGQGIVYWFGGWENQATAAQWLLGVWLLCSLDLWCLAKTVLASLRWMNSTDSKRINHSFATLYWGAFKLICLGLLVLSLLEAQKVLQKGPQALMLGLVLGAGTLLIVPFFGGVLWNQRLLRDA